MKTYFLQVKEVVKETQDSISIHFWHPISEQIKYKAGQFISIIVPAGENGINERRSYSMSTSPVTDTALGVTVKRVEGGLVSNYLLDHVKTGDFLEVIEPMGNFFFEPDETKSETIVLVGAGSGITPLISVVKTALHAQPNSKVVLLYGNRTRESIIFKKELEDLELAYPDRFKVTHVLTQYDDTWVGEKGRINRASAVIYLKEADVHFKEEQFYLCGPQGMMDELEAVFSVYNLPKEQIHKEKFTSQALTEEAIKESGDSLKAQEVTINYDGETHTFAVEPYQTILEAALELDIDLPYSCQAGMCTACLGKCSTGKVKLDEEDGLTQAELAEGYMLTCVAHPLTDDVVIDID